MNWQVPAEPRRCADWIKGLSPEYLDAFIADAEDLVNSDDVIVTGDDESPSEQPTLSRMLGAARAWRDDWCEPLRILAAPDSGAGISTADDRR